MKINSNTDRGGRAQDRSDASATGTNQSFEEATFSTLDAICRSSEETYDKFMKGFVYLKPENVNKPASDDDGPPAEFLEFQQRLKVRQTSDTPAGATNIVSDLADLTVNDPISETITAEKPNAENAMEEEVLGVGTTHKSYLMRCDVTSKSLKVKVGNFVDDDEESSEADDDESYSPSFTTGQNFSVNTSDKTETPLDNNKSYLKNSNSKMNSVQPGTDGNRSDSTEKQCNIMKEHIIVNHPTLDISTNCENASDKLNRSGGEFGQSILEMKGIFAAPTTETDDLLDLVGQCGSYSEEAELVYDPTKDRPNFGEVEDEAVNDPNMMGKIRKMATETLLEFKVMKSVLCEQDDETAGRTNRSEENPSVASETETKESCSDEVEAFIFDTEFDYDNVTLTPKYSAEEMAIMMNASSLAK